MLVAGNLAEEKQMLRRSDPEGNNVSITCAGRNLRAAGSIVLPHYVDEEDAIAGFDDLVIQYVP